MVLFCCNCWFLVIWDVIGFVFCWVFLWRFLVVGIGFGGFQD